MYVIYPPRVELDTKGLLDPKHYQFSKTCVLFDFLKSTWKGTLLGAFILLRLWVPCVNSSSSRKSRGRNKNHYTAWPRENQASASVCHPEGSAQTIRSPPLWQERPLSVLWPCVEAVSAPPSSAFEKRLACGLIEWTSAGDQKPTKRKRKGFCGFGTRTLHCPCTWISELHIHWPSDISKDTRSPPSFQIFSFVLQVTSLTSLWDESCYELHDS